MKSTLFKIVCYGALFLLICMLRPMDEQLPLLLTNGVITYERCPKHETDDAWRQSLTSEKNKREFYRTYKKTLKQHASCFYESKEIDDNVASPFQDVASLWHDIPSAKKLYGPRSWFGVIETDKLHPERVENHLHAYAKQTKRNLKRFKNPKDGRDYITTRQDILRFFFIRVEKYHEERISEVDILCPVACITCGSMDCCMAGIACFLGNPTLALCCALRGCFELLSGVGCSASLISNKPLRTQYCCINDDDFEKTSALKKSLKEVFQKHDNFYKKSFSRANE